MPEYTFDHIHLASSDPVKTAEFYEKKFAARKVIEEMPGGRKKVTVWIGDTKILVAERRSGEADKPSLDHFGIRTNDIEKAVAELQSQGVAFTMERTQIRPDFQISFLKTPDGVSIELQQGEF